MPGLSSIAVIASSVTHSALDAPLAWQQSILDCISKSEEIVTEMIRLSEFIRARQVEQSSYDLSSSKTGTLS